MYDIKGCAIIILVHKSSGFPKICGRSHRGKENRVDWKLLRSQTAPRPPESEIGNIDYS